ncbi:hypothetical protein O0L34_g7050 [Tuta absoluta]|nr:hypothetical protein O0L34_g7050 [Tuta absoluta]
MDREEGEMSDDNAMLIDEDIKSEPAKLLDEDHTMLYKAEKNGIIVTQLEKIDAVKLDERAKRFGLDLSGNRVVTQKQIDELYAKSGIESGNERHFRFDTLHLNGIDGLTTREIFEYLEDYKPVSLEKIDDTSCNIVCQDHISAALALLVHSREIKNEQINDMLKEKSHHHWREGMPHPKKDLILMRFSTNADKKVSSKSKTKEKEKKEPDEYYDESMDPISKNPWGDLCRSWGVYDHQEVFQRRLPKHDFEDDVEEVEAAERIQIRNKKLASRLGKRRYKNEETEESSSDSEWKKKSKTPRMRMHADDEESKQKKQTARRLSSEEESSPEEAKDTFTPLSIEVVNTKNDYRPREATKLSDKFKFHNNTSSKRVGNILSRLGVKVQPAPRVQPVSDEDSSSESDHHISSRVQKVKSIAKPNSSVWSRLDTTAKGSAKGTTQNDLRQMLKSKKDTRPSSTRPDDLRERLSQAKKSNLRIEIDNF